MTPEDRFEVYLDFWGYGNPYTARILFVGLEEGLGWEDALRTAPSQFERTLDTDVALRQKSGQPYLFHERWSDFDTCWRQVYGKLPDWWNRLHHSERKQCYLAMRIRRMVFAHSIPYGRPDIPNYYRYDFCREHEFQANLFPIAFASERSFSSAIRDYVAVPGERKEDYYAATLDHRIGVIRQIISTMRTEGRQPFVFFMHKTRMLDNAHIRSKLEGIFPGACFGPIDVNGRNYRCSNDRLVWFTDHPSMPRWLTYRRADKIVEMMHDAAVVSQNNRCAP